ncbi:MAG: energy-coupling factor transporter ATPase [Oscillospiraceae bacterium]|nr:energy-coupling factor transporter ATPase [Oscillospiraceae bacterium]
MNEKTPIIQVEKLTHKYSAGTPFETTAIKDIDLTICSGEMIAVIGHTGSGKSTFIQHLNGLLKPTSGRVLFSGQDIHSSKKMTRDVRFKVGLVFQYPEYQLFEETVYKDIAFGPKNMKLSESEINERVMEAAEFVGLDKRRLDESPFDLSGGQKRRVAIAGVIAMRPEVLILDEPTAGLDPHGCDEILKNIRDYHDATGSAVILVTHNMSEAARNVDRMLVFNKGQITMDGTPHQVFERSAELREMHLSVPWVTKVVMKLREKGVDIDPAVYTVEQARDAILSLKGGGIHA